MEDEKIKNSLIGTFHENNKYYIQIYNINKNVIQKELMSELVFQKRINSINNNENIKNEAFCFNCKRNINLDLNSECKKHNIKHLNELSKDINIEIIEKNMKQAIENYENILKILEEKLDKFKKRNSNQIKLSQKIIEIYKDNINNLNYQIILNTKNILNFNDIKLKNYLENNFKYIFEEDILKQFSVKNYLNEQFNIENIQKNLEIKYDLKLDIEKVIFLDEKEKIIFNTKKNIFLLNVIDYKTEHKIISDDNILSLNLLNDKKTILISYPDSIKKLKINNDKMIIEDFLNNIDIDEPGIVIKYQDEYAWTNGEYIEFSVSKIYSFRDGLNLYESDYEIHHEYNLINIFPFFDSILYVCLDRNIIEGDWYDYIIFGSYKNGLNSNKYIELEKFSKDFFYDYEKIHNEFKSFIFKYDEIIIFGILGIYIINPFKMELKEKIIFLEEFIVSEKIIENVYYLNNSCFLIFGKKLLDNLWNKIDNEKEVIKNSENIILIMKILENSNQVIFEKLLDFKTEKIYYSPNNNKNNKFNFNNQFISVQNDNILVYELVNISKKKELKNNNFNN